MLESKLNKKIRSAIKLAFPKDVYYKIHGSASQERGIPDILGSHGGRFVGMEVKTPERLEKKGPTAYQQRQLDIIRKSGGIAGVVASVKEAIALISNSK